MNVVKKKCPICNVKFEGSRFRVYCGDACKNTTYTYFKKKEKKENTCEHCKQVYYSNMRNTRFCNNQCRDCFKNLESMRKESKPRNYEAQATALGRLKF